MASSAIPAEPVIGRQQSLLIAHFEWCFVGSQILPDPRSLAILDSFSITWGDMLLAAAVVLLDGLADASDADYLSAPEFF